MELTAANVEATLVDCLPKDVTEAEARMMIDNGQAVLVEGPVHSYALIKDKLEEHRGEVRDMLAQLPYTFRATIGGGWSFLQACNRQDGEQWTGMHLTMEQLFLLGEATGQASLLLPRAMWDILPNGMPYYIINDTDWGDIDVEAEKVKYLAAQYMETKG